MRVKWDTNEDKMDQNEVKLGQTYGKMNKQMEQVKIKGG